KNKSQTWAICSAPFQIEGIKQKGNALEKRYELYQWRNLGLNEQLDLEQLAIVLLEINSQINNSSGYLGAISDRSKELYFNNQTIGQYLYNQLNENPHTRLKNQVFYRQDYLDEFEQVWKTQSKNRKDVLSDELKKEIRDVIIFYQRRLKSQKGLISICELEGKEKEIEIDGKKKWKIVGPRVIPKSSPLFQEFKIWQVLNNLEIRNITTKEKKTFDLETKQKLFEELNIKGKLSNSQVLKLVVDKPKEWELNYKEWIEGNLTNKSLYKAYQNILELSGHEIDISKLSTTVIKEAVSGVFELLGIKKEILDFDGELEGKAFEQQMSYQLWHLLYSYEGDNSYTGNDKLFEKLKDKFGFNNEYAQALVNIVLQDDYGSLSTKAIRKILPYLKEGNEFLEACALAGYDHSHSLTKEENENRVLKDTLALLPKNSLRNPVVEKILNQMINVVNAIIEKYGKPDEIRIELARELKKSAKERTEMTSNISKATKKHDEIRKEIAQLPPFNTGVRITRNDIIKYKLYEELSFNGYKTLYTNTYTPKEKLFSNEFDIEHIIPKATLFDDSFSNKTLSARQINLDKGNKTAYDFLTEKYGEESEEFKNYLQRVEALYKDKKISKAKYTKLLMKCSEIPDGFIERDLRNSQYIAKKALKMLWDVVKTVTPTTGSITDKLREDWQLINVMQELNWDKYEKLGLTEYEINKYGNKIPKIKGWTKRNDHRHHAMDALTVAFTKHSHIQYFNYLNAREDENHKQHGNIYAIEQKETYISDKNKRLIKPPMPIEQFRADAKMCLENTLVSFKVKNKLVTLNKNKIKGSDKVYIEL
ncbi:MAG: type II CRISPR RNA-guided endonuclease Cas9, partial [Bacteroidetes bacterium]|nr:type II CRISPR RNA-guided endonuclease Cas9 [Bacteroidota bacterium]